MKKASDTVREKARAKVNLTLHVTGQRDDGYHLLDSLVCFPDIADVVTARAADELRFSVDGPLAAGVPTDETNLVVKAAQFFGVAAEITLTKNLPSAAGIGGGSADAAACLRALSRLSGQPLPAGVQELGADVPVCMKEAPVRMRGVGERLDSAPLLPEAWIVLVNPGISVATPMVFEALTNKENDPMSDLPCWKGLGELVEWLKRQRNDLEGPATRLVPEIGAVLDALDQAEFARMSGSGATCYGLFADNQTANSVAAEIQINNPDWWVASSRL